MSGAAEALAAARAALRDALAAEADLAAREAKHHHQRHLVLSETLRRLKEGDADVLAALLRESLPRDLGRYVERPTALAVRYGLSRSEADAASWLAAESRSSGR